MPRVQQLSAAYVTPDIAPYKAVAGDRAGQYITSRREHREYLKRNRLVEIGNEKPKDTSKMREVKKSHNERVHQREQLKQTIRSTLKKA